MFDGNEGMNHAFIAALVLSIFTRRRRRRRRI